MTKPEILAPAGSWEQLCAAVRTGADAVYLGYNGLSARAGADNPSGEGLRRATEYCRERGVRIYVALNTLVRDGEWDGVLGAVQDICSCGVDGVIVQDAGIARMLKRCAPQLALHASTQMSIHSPAGASLLAEKGFKRVVLAREMSCEEIGAVISDTCVETEVFVHGAMCMSVSGQCYLSSMLGGRSGNRGLCAQPCRLPFSTEGSQGYDLSLRDMSLVKHIPTLAKMGVTSLKIEGRLKRPEYVAAAVTACRAAVDGENITDDIFEKLQAVFSRSGFSDGYFTGHRGKIMFGFRRKDDVTAANHEVLASLRSLYREERRSVELESRLCARVGQPLSIELSDGINTVRVTGETVAAASENGTSAKRLCEQLCKTGGTPYFVPNPVIETEGAPFVPISLVNGLRRTALEGLSDKRKQVKAIPFEMSEDKLPLHAAAKAKLRACFCNFESIPDCAAGCELVFVPVEACIAKPERVHEFINRGFNLGVSLPGANFGAEDRLCDMLKKAAQMGICHALVQNLGQIALVREAGMVMHGGFRLNLANSTALAEAQSLGFEDITASFELTFSQIAALRGTIERGLIVYGHLPLMLTRNCPAANGEKTCDRCQGHGVITDRRGESFNVTCRMGCSELLNPVPLCVFDKLKGVNADFHILYFTTETKQQAEKVFGLYSEGKKLPQRATNGLYTRGIE